MRWLVFLVVLAVTASVVFAENVKPVASTLKKPYNAAASYCNVDGQAGLLNVVCYNHDACYSDPTFKGTKKPPATRDFCDQKFLKECRKVASAIKCTVMYGPIKSFGFISWNNARSHDKTEK